MDVRVCNATTYSLLKAEIAEKKKLRHDLELMI